MEWRRFAWGVIAAAASPFLLTGCPAVAKVLCLGDSDPTPEEARAMLEAMRAEVERSGVRIDAEMMRDPARFSRYLEAFDAAAGARAHRALPADVGVARQRLDVTFESYCGPGHDNFATSLPVVPCLDEICQAHDACYSECSGDVGLCVWSKATDPCDQAMFDSVDSCSFRGHGYERCIASWAVYLAARTVSLLNHNNPLCSSSGIVCPGKGACLVERSGDACQACLGASDPGGACLAEECANADDSEQCYKASCPQVAGCYGGWGAADAP